MQSIIRLLGIICGVLLLFSIASAEGQWELIKSKDGIDTYRMTHAGTEVCTFKGVGFVDAKIEVIGEVMRDIPAYPEWMAKFKKTTILKTIDRNTYVFHAVIKAPIPYQNRDLVIENQTKYNFNNGSALLTFRSANNFSYPEQNCCLRLTEMEGQYYFEYFGRNKTRVTYQYRSHPGGNIPVGLANEIEIKHYPAITIDGLRKMVKKEKYIKAGLASPEHDMIERMLDSKKDVENIMKNRIGEYIIDPVLLNMLFELAIPKKIVDNVYATRSDFASIRQGMVDLFDVVGDTSLNGQLKQEVDGLAAYLADKKFDSFFSINKFMGETWLIDEITKDKKLIYGLFETKSNLAKVIFEKVTTSRTAVKSFIKDKGLAEKILTNSSLRKKLWEDKVLRDRLAKELGTFKNTRDFENLIAERVKNYSL
ncbi:MAG: START domain-containing protein [Deltaproteobacteria bacterium]|nr:START domain-containing protein [Deltaproteobacteria bacterium]